MKVGRRLERTAVAQLTCPVGRLAVAAEFGPRAESGPALTAAEQRVNAALGPEKR